MYSDFRTPSVSIRKDGTDAAKTDTYGFRRYNLLSADGISLLDGKDLSDREYFQQAIKGEACVSEPLVSAVTGEVTVIVAAPIWQNGQIGSQVEGVVCFIPTETFMSDIMKTIQISEGGSAYMLDQIGNTIAHPNLEAVRNKENTIREAKTDPSLAPLASIESEMIDGKSGFGEYSYDGGNIFNRLCSYQGYKWLERCHQCTYLRLYCCHFQGNHHYPGSAGNLCTCFQYFCNSTGIVHWWAGQGLCRSAASAG